MHSSQLGFLLGTLAPLLRASDRPIAIACSRLLTTPPFPSFPERNSPRFSRCTAFLTLSLAALPYRAISPPGFLKLPGNAAMHSRVSSSGQVPQVRRTRYRYANLLSRPEIDSNRNMRCEGPAR